MIGLGVGIDYSLFIVTRFRQLLHEGLSPADAAAEAGASAGRAVLFAGTTVAISVTGLAFFGLDFVTKLGIGSALGVLTTVLIANSLLHRGPAPARPQGRPAEGAVPAADRRLRGGPREDADRPLGTVRDRAREADLRRPRSSPASAWLPRRCSCASAPPTRARSRPSRRPGGPTTCSPRASGPGFNGPIPIVVDVNDDPEAPQRIYDGLQGARRRRLGGRAAVQRRGDGGDRLRDAGLGAAGRSDGRPRPHPRDDVVPAATEGGDAVAYVPA